MYFIGFTSVIVLSCLIYIYIYIKSRKKISAYYSIIPIDLVIPGNDNAEQKPIEKIIITIKNESNNDIHIANYLRIFTKKPYICKYINLMSTINDILVKKKENIEIEIPIISDEIQNFLTLNQNINAQIDINLLGGTKLKHELKRNKKYYIIFVNQ